MILNFDCLVGLKELAEDSVDLVTTDPPYGLGFMGKDWDKALPDKRVWKECLRVLKPGAFAFVMSIPRADCLSRMIISLEDVGFRVNFTPMYHTYASGFPKAQNIGKAVDKRLGAEREVIGIDDKKAKRFIRGLANQNDGWDRPWMHQEDAIERKAGITESSTPQAKALDGSYGGFQPKPAVEVIIVCMKPLSEKTFVDQALKNGKGITWLGDCRIPYESDGDKSQATPQGKCTGQIYDSMLGRERKEFDRPEQKGRFPANLLVSDDVLNDGRTISYGNSKEPYSYRGKHYNVKGFIKDNSPQAPSNYGDSGSFSRYFDLDKWWVERVKKLPESVQKTFSFLIVPKASKSEKNKGLEDLPDRIGGGMQGTADKSLKTGSGNERNNLMKNIHPTVKPIKLMSYLVTLGSREGDTVVDPFMGSGTTGIACEILGRKFIGYEIDKDYFEIAKKRIEACKK